MRHVDWWIGTIQLVLGDISNGDWSRLAVPIVLCAPLLIPLGIYSMARRAQAMEAACDRALELIDGRGVRGRRR